MSHYSRILSKGLLIGVVPAGAVHYQLYVYTLDTTLDLPDTTKPKELITALTPCIIDYVALTGKFGVFDIFWREL